MKLFTNFSIILTFSLGLLLFAATNSSAEGIKVKVMDCDTKEPISNVQIFTVKDQFLGSTDDSGFANLKPSKEHIHIQKLGYEPIIISAQELGEICLSKKAEELKEVSILGKRVFLYDSLRALRNKNLKDFLDYEAILTYSFKYKTTSLDEKQIFDQAEGYFTVQYKPNYTYPNLFTNENDYAKVIDFQYSSDPSKSSTFFNKIKYLDPATLLCCYDVMERKFNTLDWWNFRSYEIEKATQFIEDEKGGKTYITFRNDSLISRKFHFDSKDKIQNVEIFEPIYFYRSNSNLGKTNFYVRVGYSSTLPRVANHYSHTYTFESDTLSYKTDLEIVQVYPQKQTLLIPNEQKKMTVFSLIGSFFDLTQEIESAKQKIKKK